MNGDEIRRMREARGMTQEDLAIALGVGPRTIGNWERQKTLPKNRAGMLRAFFGLDRDAAEDPLGAASEVELLSELLRRAVGRERKAQ
jgi:transcriptional regulator with XRE-family HTH domain